MPDEFDEYGDKELNSGNSQVDALLAAKRSKQAQLNAIRAKQRESANPGVWEGMIGDILEDIASVEKQLQAATASTSKTVTVGGVVFKEQRGGTYKEVARDPFLDADRKFKEEEARIRNALAAQKISLDQAKQMLDAENQRLQREATAEYQRSQIATTKRGQDLTYASTQRGQNMNYASNLAQTGSDAMMRSLPYLAPEGTNADLANAINSIGSGKPVNVQPRSMQFPFNPADIGTQIAAMVLRNISPTAAQVADGGPVPTAETAPQVSSDAQAALGAGSQGFTVPPVQSQGKPGFVAPSLGSNFSSGNRMRPI